MCMSIEMKRSSRLGELVFLLAQSFRHDTEKPNSTNVSCIKPRLGTNWFHDVAQRCTKVNA